MSRQGVLRGVDFQRLVAQAANQNERIQSNHFLAAIYAFMKLECMKMNRFAARFPLRLKDVQAAFEELQGSQVGSAELASHVKVSC